MEEALYDHLRIWHPGVVRDFADGVFSTLEGYLLS